MDKSITQLGQDLALAKYAKTTRESYLRTAEHLSGRFKRPLTDRVGIANSRLLAVSAEAITFRTKGTGTETLAPVVFLTDAVVVPGLVTALLVAPLSAHVRSRIVDPHYSPGFFVFAFEHRDRPGRKNRR